MYLDELPSAITLGEGDTLYEENIPIGFFPNVSQNSYDGLLRETAIFNHLDFKVIVSPAWMTSQKLSSEKENEQIKVSVYGYDINVPLPLSAFRITGFEITPRSIPTGKACTPNMYEHGFHAVIPDETFQFSYSVTIVMGDLTSNWPSRLDHYLNLTKNKVDWY